MKLHPFGFVLPSLICAATSTAVKIPVNKAKNTQASLQRRGGNAPVSRPNAAAGSNVLAATPATGNSLQLGDVQDLLYLANITVGGVAYPVQLDTGSSDLWVKGTTSPLPGVTDTSRSVNLTYGIGWAYGNVGYAAVEFAGISVAKQAILDVSSADNPALSYNADGILGLGFNALSNIDAVVNKTGASSGRSLLYNLFLDNPEEPNFIAFSLQTTSGADGIQGLFSIGETDPQYSAVTSEKKVSTWPVTFPDRWSILLDSFIIGSQTISVSSSVIGAPSDQAVVVLDSGTSYTYAPTEVCKAIYGGVSGAKYSADIEQWIVPCDVEIDMALQFNGRVYPVDPLDIVPTNPDDPTTCVGSFVPSSGSVGAGEFDWLIGDNFLRNVYTLYDFGDFDSSGKMGNPYIQMLPLVDPNAASVQFHKVRGGTSNGNITYNASNSTGSGGSTPVTLSADVANTIDKLSKYLPAVLGLVALNALLLIVLTIVGLVLLCRKGGKVARMARKQPGRLSPMPLNASAYSEPAHTYQPVSMALTEDTLFAPPSPAFKGDGVKDRPRSVA